MHRLCGLLLVGAFFSSPAWAGGPDDRIAIQRLAQKLQAAAARQSDPQALADARRLMRRALNRLERGSRRDHRSACVQYVQPIYARGYTEARAMEKALEACKTPVDMELLRFAQPIYANGYTATSALKRALEFARTPGLRRRLPMVRFAYDIFKAGYTATSALKRAKDFALALPQRQDSCVRSAYPVYRRSYTGAVALRRAAKTCQK